MQKLYPSKLVGLANHWLWSLGRYVMSSPIPVLPSYLAQKLHGAANLLLLGVPGNVLPTLLVPGVNKWG